MLPSIVRRNGDMGRADHPLGLAGGVYDRLVGMILSGELVPRQPLRVHSLAKRLGVSATPVREALVRASTVGIVERRNNIGFSVAPQLDAKEFDDLFEARIAIEQVTAKMAASRISGAQIELLEETWTYQRDWSVATGLSGFQGFLEADRRFHRVIAQAAGNRFLLASWDMLGSHVQRFRSFESGVVADQAETLAEHRMIIEALRAANPMAAEAAMVVHLSQLRDRVQREQEDNDSIPH